MILTPNTGRLETKTGSNAQWIAHSAEVKIPIMSQLTFASILREGKVKIFAITLQVFKIDRLILGLIGLTLQNEQEDQKMAFVCRIFYPAIRRVFPISVHAGGVFPVRPACDQQCTAIFIHQPGWQDHFGKGRRRQSLCKRVFFYHL